MKKIEKLITYIFDSYTQFKYVSDVLLGNSKTPYIGWVGQNNLGDEILFEAHLKLFPELNIFYFKKSRIIDLYYQKKRKKLFDIGILGGGTLINQSNYWFEQVKYLQDMNLKMFCIGTGVASGEFLSSKTDSWNDETQNWLNALSSFIFVGVRGPYSQAFLNKYNFKRSIIVGDTALSLAKDDYIKKKKQGIIGINYGINKSQSVWGDEQKYTIEMANFIKELINKGYKVHLLPIFIEDLASNKKLLELVNNDNCLLKNNFANLENYSKELNTCDVFLGQKLHSTIISTMNRIPSVMIEYNPKCRDYMASIDMEHYVIRTSEFSSNKAIKMLQDILKEYENIQNNLNTKILKYKKLQFESAQLIKKKLGIL